MRHTGPINLYDAHVLKTKNFEISCWYMITKEYLLLWTDKYIQFILQPYPGFQEFTHVLVIPILHGGGRVVRRCWVNLQCRGVLLIWIIVGQGPVALAVGAGGGCLDIFSLICPFSPLSPSLWETARYRLKYCLKGPLNPKQPTKPILHV